jgi:hypothetical protein
MLPPRAHSEQPHLAVDGGILVPILLRPPDSCNFGQAELLTHTHTHCMLTARTCADVHRRRGRGGPRVQGH